MVTEELLLDVTEETDYNTTIKFEPDDITEEIVIPVPPSAVIPQSTKVEKQEHIPICDAVIFSLLLHINCVS